MKKKILVVVHTNTWFTEMFRVTQLLLKSQEFEPVVHFVYDYPTIKDDIEKIKALNLQYIVFSNINQTHMPFLIRWFMKILAFVSYVLTHPKLRTVSKYFSFGIVVVNSLLRSLNEISIFKKVIVQTDARLVVMGGDLVGYNTPEVVKASHACGVACVIVPSTMSDGTEQAEAYYFDRNFSAEAIENRLVAKIWPKWKKQHKQKTLVRLHAAEIINRQLLKLDPPLPWISSSTRGDCIIVESLAMKDYYLRCGIAENLLQDAGSISNDELAKALHNQNVLRQNLVKELGLDLEKKMILTALPPDSLYMTGGRPECEFKTYRELTIFWIETLRKASHYNIIISLHPSVNIEDFRYLESENVKISGKSIVHLIPLCDVFVASVSSTIRWAIACAKPVVNYDVYIYRYADFMKVKGVIYLDQSKEYVNTIQKLNEDQQFVASVQNQIATEASYWGNTDGREGERILGVFRNLIAARGK